MGHSSGAHLSACALTRLPHIGAALPVSGVYDLLPVRLSARNEYVNHLEIIETLADPASPLGRAALNMLG